MPAMVRDRAPGIALMLQALRESRAPPREDLQKPQRVAARMHIAFERGGRTRRLWYGRDSDWPLAIIPVTLSAMSHGTAQKMHIQAPRCVPDCQLLTANGIVAHAPRSPQKVCEFLPTPFSKEAKKMNAITVFVGGRTLNASIESTTTGKAGGLKL
ncbi:hypothetical protein [Paraburkholderia aspalathi]|uniref:hypothetical protein n=1 Tax=Paraburkholderia aspalathi TaxID=1324617 RepID=UPI001160244A|nr:hypothetical protein [Paraburkholderia aspalathi]